MKNYLNTPVLAAFDPLVCGSCTPATVTKPTDSCTTDKTAGKEALWIFYNCTLTKADAGVTGTPWATIEDVLTDVGGANAVSLKVVDEGKPVFTPNTIERGLRTIKTNNSITIPGTWTFRQSDNSDITFMNNIADWDASAQLRLAVITQNNDILDYDYGIASFAAAAGFQWNQNETEEHKIDTVVMTNQGKTIFDDARALADAVTGESAYSALYAVSY